MIDLFFNGGPIFMGLLTLILLSIVVLSGISVILIYNRKINNYQQTIGKINSIRSFGFFALIVGLLGQLIGLFSAFRAIKMGEVEASTSLFFEGFKISMITAVYGILIFSISVLAHFLLKRAVKALYAP
ncbi:MotA/TolQ/ExbB proton channel family protein [Salegentibacter sediminis]|uniref:MotA/TolQ/ExbB proton channel family protein n=1 Tax=Salegentibacter sediminis TaxID=1930251 RepID=UPI0009C10CC3|nr:MotA/TolQ/ExbB proton channel family protein [Salegentibacter sediminis]